MDALTKDPVCGMEVKPHQNEIVYLGVQYAFCSQMCQKQFLKEPHLYIEPPVHAVDEQQGKALVKSRRMHLDALLSPEQAERLILALQQMNGVIQVSAQAKRLDVNYDALQTTAEQIESKLMEVGNNMGDGWAERLRQAFIHYEEECQIGNHAEKG